jgi:20S proteasome alpha/beta subunit
MMTTLWARAGAYGSTKRYKSVQRMIKVNDTCIVGASGEISDFQRIKEMLEELETEDFLAGDAIVVTPRQVHAYLTRVMYNRRNKCAYFQTPETVAIDFLRESGNVFQSSRSTIQVIIGAL